MASSLPFVRLLGVVLLLGVLPACSSSRYLSPDAPPPSGAPPGGTIGPAAPASGSTGGGSAGITGSMGAPPSSGTGGR